MKTRTKAPEKERATCLGQQVAPKYHSQDESYRRPIPPSSLKTQIAGLLFFMQFPSSQKQRQIGWKIFEAKLQKYVELRISGGSP